jgi:hypothetical protein
MYFFEVQGNFMRHSLKIWPSMCREMILETWIIGTPYTVFSDV